MVKLGLWVRLETKKEKAEEVKKLLQSALPLANAEARTVVWFAVQLGPTTFAVFDAFEDEEGRKAHLNGDIAAALMAKAGELLAAPPRIEPHDVLAAKLPR